MKKEEEEEEYVKCRKSERERERAGKALQMIETGCIEKWNNASEKLVANIQEFANNCLKSSISKGKRKSIR